MGEAMCIRKRGRRFMKNLASAQFCCQLKSCLKKKKKKNKKTSKKFTCDVAVIHVLLYQGIN